MFQRLIQLKDVSPLFDVDMTRLDLLAWALVALFFGSNAALFGGNVQQALWNALSIVLLMLCISHSIDLILRALSRNARLGEITGYLTNGPEALVLLVGLLHHKLTVAMGVPLGSNYANPLLMLVAACITGSVIGMIRQNPVRTGLILLVSMTLAGRFFWVKGHPQDLLIWAVVTLLISVLMYIKKGSESDVEGGEGDDELPEPISFWYVFPAGVLLVIAGYFLDPVVSQAAQVSHVPEGVISFVVLSFMTSWPEFRAALALFRRHQPGAAVMNIVVSNLTNLWLAVSGAFLYLLSFR